MMPSFDDPRWHPKADRLWLLAHYEPHEDDEQKQQQQDEPPPLCKDAATITGNRPHRRRWKLVNVHFSREVVANHRDVESTGVMERPAIHTRRCADSLRFLSNAEARGPGGIERPLGNSGLGRDLHVACR